MNNSYFMPLLKSTQVVLGEVVDLDQFTNKNRRELSNSSLADITAFIYMASPAKSESIFCVSFSESLILELSHRMLGRKFSEVEFMVTDLAGEITSMLLGNFINLLGDAEAKFSMALPIVIARPCVTSEHGFSSMQTISFQTVSFETSFGELSLAACSGEELLSSSEYDHSTIGGEQ